MTVADVPIGELLAGRYRVERVLGCGGFGAVYMATDSVIGRNVAIKVLAQQHIHSEDTKERFLREARALAVLQGEHGAQLHDVGVLADGRPFLSMEYLQGHDLQEELRKRGPLPVIQAVRTVVDVCRGLAAAHAQGIVHRDLKPQNIFWAFRPDGTHVTKLLDFGVARVAQATPLTQSGAWVGTPRFMSPEQLMSPGSVDTRADIWALGVVLYEILTAKPIFDASSAAQYASKVLTERPVPLRARMHSLDAALEAVVDRCLQQEPARRFQSVVELANALLPFSGGAAPLSSAAGSSPQRALALSAPPVDAASTIAGPPRAPMVAPQTTAGPLVAAPRDAPARGSMGVALGLGGVTLGLLAIAALGAVALVMRQQERAAQLSAPPSSSPAAGSAAKPASGLYPRAEPSVAATPPTSAATTSASTNASVTSVAKEPPKGSSKPAAPSQGETAAIAALCYRTGYGNPYWLVPGNKGSHGEQCGRVGALGCNGVRARCAAEPVGSAGNTCSQFVAGLKTEGICP
jgi:eukaryotic-like serine/threonine-protein kinase